MNNPSHSKIFFFFSGIIIYLLLVIVPSLAENLPRQVQTGSADDAVPDIRRNISGENSDISIGIDSEESKSEASELLPYADNGDGTVTDKRTGLMWVKDCTGDGCLSGATTSWEYARIFCENLTYAGYTDWRLPSRDELKGILDTGVSDENGNDTRIFKTNSGYYWSSTNYEKNSSYGFVVSFPFGFMLSYDKNKYRFYVRPVRGGQ